MNRKDIINAIIEAAREPVPKIVEIIQCERPDTHQPPTQGTTPRTSENTNSKVVGYAFANPQGLLYGQIEHSIEVLVKRHKEQEDEEMRKFRAQLEWLSDAELKLQAILWLNHGASQQPEPSTSDRNKQDRERDIRLWRMMEARGDESGDGSHFPQTPRVGLNTSATGYEGWSSGDPNRPDGELAPYFHVSHDAKHSLLSWLSECPEHVFGAFIMALTAVLSQTNPRPCLADYFCASPRHIATAADEALRSSGLYEKAQNNNVIKAPFQFAAAAA